MTDKKYESRKDLEEKIIVRAWKDPAFRKLLLDNPKEALKQLPLSLPHNTKIEVIEEQPDEWSIVLHHAPQKSKTLSEEELYYIAGGCGYGHSWVPPEE